MKLKSHVALLAGLCLLLINSCASCYAETPKDVLAQRVALWEKFAPLCMGNPSKRKEDPNAPDVTCNDGDMNLFSGLLCAAGITAGCVAVRAAFVDTGADAGRWHRSPRRKNDPTIDELEGKDGVASFSPDMALGAQLYLATTHDIPVLQMWLTWLDAHRPCAAGDEPRCDVVFAGVTLKKNVRGWPRFCTDDRPIKDDPGHGCSMRPGDLANLAATRYYLSPLHMAQVNCAKDLGEFGDYLRELVEIEPLIQRGLPRLLDISCGLAPAINRISAELNKPGYSQHLVAVEILLYRKLGIADSRIAESAGTLAAKQPNNPFFQYLAHGATDAIRNQVLTLCPATEEAAKNSAQTQWAWERADSDQAWKQANLWDCLFIARLLLS